MRETVRAGAAKPVSRTVDLHQEEGHAGAAGSLKRGQPGRRLLEGDAEAGGEHGDIVARAGGRLMEGGIGHHQRMSGVAAELEAGEPARLVGGQFQRLRSRQRPRRACGSGRPPSRPRATGRRETGARRGRGAASGGRSAGASWAWSRQAAALSRCRARASARPSARRKDRRQGRSR